MTPVVIPAKPLAVALRRLRGVLDADERVALQAAMLTDVLTAATVFSQRVVVVTADRLVGELARSRGALVAPDTDPPRGINTAVARGITAAPAPAVLVVMGDLPCISSDDLQQVAAARPVGRGVSLAVSGDGTGTNAMLLAPPDAIAPAFGVGSLERHLSTAEAAELECTVVTAPGLMLDVDTPADLALLVRSRPASATRELCTALELESRLAVAALG